MCGIIGGWWKIKPENIESIIQKSIDSIDHRGPDDKGIDFVDEVTIYNLPSSKVGELKIKIIFELTKDDTLAMSVDITEKNGNKIDSGNVKIKKASQE